LPMLASTHAYTLVAVNHQVADTSGTIICSPMYDKVQQAANYTKQYMELNK
jgi:hypothetical protein